MINLFDKLPREIENYIYQLSSQMLFSNVKKELDQTYRYIYQINPNYDTSRGIIEWLLPNKKTLKLTNKQIYMFNFLSDDID